MNISRIEKRKAMYKDDDLVIRPIKRQDLDILWELMYKEDAPEWKKWDAPYFPHESMPYEKFMESADTLINQDERWVILINDVVFGTVSYYFEDVQQVWLEMGILILEGQNWGKGIGTRAISLWMSHIFNRSEEHTSELQSRGHLVCRLLLEKKNKNE